ncbi:MAG: hypothetical protein KC478_10310 [Bacteriovoracaceae bacterium]|nr:hypothetical protein [Bacteriovoracaceae bacterium]
MELIKFSKFILKGKMNHFQLRLMERKGIWLSEFEVFELADQILSGHGLFRGVSKKDPGNCAFYTVTINGEDISLVFDHQFQIPLTIISNKGVPKKVLQLAS